MLRSLRNLKGEFQIEITEINEHTIKANTKQEKLILDENIPETIYPISFSAKF